MINALRPEVRVTRAEVIGRILGTLLKIRINIQHLTGKYSQRAEDF